MAAKLPPVPPVMKPIQHYLKTAAEHDQRDPVISYWCRLFALQGGMKIDKKTKESVALLTALMDWLEQKKKELSGNEAITNEVVAQAHIENYALKLFLYADTEDRASRFNKNVVKAFYSAGMLFDVLATFGELTDEVIHHRKYAKWKAAYIHNCLKNGETPLPGPLTSEDEDPYLEGATGGAPDILGTMGAAGYSQPSFSGAATGDANSTFNDPRISENSYDAGENMRPTSGLVAPGFHAPPSTPAEQSSTSSSDSVGGTAGGVRLSTEDCNKAQKYCKWACSALQYEDISTAISNLQKALRLLTVGKDD